MNELNRNFLSKVIEIILKLTIFKMLLKFLQLEKNVKQIFRCNVLISFLTEFNGLHV